VRRIMKRIRELKVRVDETPMPVLFQDVRYNVGIRLKAAFVRDGSSLRAPLIVGLGVWLSFPTVTAYQDMASMVSGIEGRGTRWNAYVEKAAAGSVHAGEMPFLDPDAKVGSISGAGISAPGIGTVAFRGKGGVVSATPDEERVNRAEKKGRLVKIAPVAPPKSFNAGSVFQRTGSLLRPEVDETLKMAFVKPEIKGKEVEIAAAFHARQEKRLAGISPVLASLVTNEKADILATAYGPPEPDYAEESPFASLLKDPNEGRFIPPATPGDHPWMSQPLPASVFSEKEQKCLANAIYFEARGESLRGQAAVAQVVLNRVRNPTYPDTICGVVYQNKHLRNRCQFSFACDRIKDRVRSRSHYETAEEIAMAVTAGKIFLPEIGSSTHYYATYVRPGWARAMQRMKRIGLHIFYRTHGGGWS
jgi:spore germination cell wall hydrolase CwlJ-like protein